MMQIEELKIDPKRLDFLVRTRQMTMNNKSVIAKYYPRLAEEADVKQFVNYVHLAKLHKTDPNTGHLRWLSVEANLVYNNNVPFLKLNIPCFWFIQYYPWFLRKFGSSHRLFVGYFATYKDESELWVGWVREDDHELKLKFYGHCQEGMKDIEFDLNNGLRKHIKWYQPLVDIFNFALMGNTVMKDQIKRQDVHLLAIAKVLARFPGLVFELDAQDKDTIYQVNGDSWATFPFTALEAPREDNPYQDFTAWLNHDDQGSLSDGDDAGKDDDATGYFDGDSEDGMNAEEIDAQDAAEQNDPHQFDNWKDEYSDGVGVDSEDENAGVFDDGDDDDGNKKKNDQGNNANDVDDEDEDDEGETVGQDVLDHLSRNLPATPTPTKSNTSMKQPSSTKSSTTTTTPAPGTYISLVRKFFPSKLANTKARPKSGKSAKQQLIPTTPDSNRSVVRRFFPSSLRLLTRQQSPPPARLLANGQQLENRP